MFLVNGVTEEGLKNSLYMFIICRTFVDFFIGIYVDTECKKGPVREFDRVV